MTRDQQEMALWREAYEFAMSQTWDYAKAEEAASAAIEAFRKRYPPQSAAPAPVWYDEPPFPKDGRHHACWVLGEDRPGMVYRGSGQWLVVRVGGLCAESLAGRRVSPITKPQEPTQ